MPAAAFSIILCASMLRNKSISVLHLSNLSICPRFGIQNIRVYCMRRDWNRGKWGLRTDWGSRSKERSVKRGFTFYWSLIATAVTSDCSEFWPLISLHKDPRGAGNTVEYEIQTAYSRNEVGIVQCANSPKIRYVSLCCNLNTFTFLRHHGMSGSKKISICLCQPPPQRTNVIIKFVASINVCILRAGCRCVERVQKMHVRCVG